MKPTEWWKNFALGIELDVAGTFIYNGIRALHELHHFQHPVDSFEILYNLSVGIERLLKVAIILIEHSESEDLNSLEESLITHNGSSRVLVESNAGMYHLSALNSLWRIYRIEDKAIK